MATPDGMSATWPIAEPHEVSAAQYANALENIFVSIRGRGVQWSSDDRARAMRWQKIGVSLPRVVSVLQLRAKAWRFLHGDASGLPARLGYYEKAVLGGATSGLPAMAAATARPAATPRITGPTAAQDRSEPTLADRLCNLLDRVPDLVREAEDPALQRAYRQAGLSLARSLQGKSKDCANGIDSEAFDAAVQRARKLVVKIALEGIGPTAQQVLEDEVDAKLRKERCSPRAAKRRRVALLDATLQQRWRLQLPSAEGWA